MPKPAFGFNTPFDEQLAFFKAKLNLPSKRWDDIMKAAHDRAFIVAGAMKADLLADLNADVTKAIEKGTGYAQFHKDFMATVKKHGWSGWTGEGTAAGEAWRSKVIYQTNMATSYAAGRYRQLTDPEFLTLRPYWRYKHADYVANPRQQHVSWNNLTLPHDHPLWQTHFAPNGWNCFPAETQVRCDATVGLKTWYAGKMVEIETAAGRRLAVTANHPILTRAGWVAASGIDKGDDLIGAGCNGDAALVGIVNHQQAPTRAENLFETLAAQGLRVVPMAPDDFHGDAALRKTEIHVAGADGALVHKIEAAMHQNIGQSRLDITLHGRVESAGIANGAPLAAAMVGNAVLAQNAADCWLGDTQAPRDLRLAEQAAAVQRNHLALGVVVAGVSGSPSGPHDGRRLTALPDADPSIAHSGAAVTNGNAVSAQDAPKRIAAGAHLFGELIEANAGLIATDKVISVREFDWAGHVYDFSTKTGLIVAGGLVVSNCHCRIIAVDGREYAKAQAAGQAEPPAGWDVRDDKGNLPGIAKGFDYAPGRTWHPDLDKYQPEVARAMVADNLRDGVFDRWHNRVAAQVAHELDKPGYVGLSKSETIDRLRATLVLQEAYPVAVLPPSVVQAMAVQTQVVQLSSHDLAKQQVSRTGQKFEAIDYFNAQGTLDSARLIVRENQQMTIFVSDQAGKWYAAVVQQTATGKGLFLKSFRRSSEKDARLQRKKGKVMLDELGE